MKSKKSVLIGVLLISLSASMWGFDGVVLTPRLAGLDVKYIVLMLHLIPFVILNIFLFKEYRHLTSFTKKDWLILALIALTGGSFGTIAIVKALIIIHFQPLSVVVLLQKLQPVFAIFLSYLLLKEKLSKRYFIHAPVVIIASYFLTFGLARPDVASSPDTIAAAIYAVIAAFCFGSATVFGKMILMRHDSKTALFYRYGLTTIIMLFIVLVFGDIAEQIQKTTNFQWGRFFIIAFTTGSTAIYIYYRGLKNVTATISTICELFLPLSAVVFDFIINGKILSPVQLIAGTVMIINIILLSLNHARINAEQQS